MVREGGGDCSIASRRYLYDMVGRFIGGIHGIGGKIRFGTMIAYNGLLSPAIPLVLRMINGVYDDQVEQNQNYRVQQGDEIGANFATTVEWHGSICSLGIFTRSVYVWICLFIHSIALLQGVYGRSSYDQMADHLDLRGAHSGQI